MSHASRCTAIIVHPMQQAPPAPLERDHPLCRLLFPASHRVGGRAAARVGAGAGAAAAGGDLPPRVRAELPLEVIARSVVPFLDGKARLNLATCCREFHGLFDTEEAFDMVCREQYGVSVTSFQSPRPPAKKVLSFMRMAFRVASGQDAATGPIRPITSVRVPA